MASTRIAVAIATMWLGTRHACSTSLRGASEAPNHAEAAPPEAPLPLPQLPNLLALGDIGNDPIAEAPRWLPRITTVTKEEAVKRYHYWVVALAGILFAGAAAAQLMVWSLILARRLRHPGYERMHANDATVCENLSDNDSETVDGKQESSDVDEEWPIGDEWGILSHINSTFLSMFLGFTALHFDAVSPTSGLDYELWAVFLVWNTAESLVQAAVRGYTIDVNVPLKKSVVFPTVFKMNIPVLSPRVDMVKDVIFTVTCLSQRATKMAIISALIIVVNSERMWALRRLRAEIREEALPLVKPPTHDIHTQTGDHDAGVPWNGMLHIVRDMSTPLKMESAMWEDFPQTALQIIYIAIFNGAMFTKVTAAIGIIKIVVVVLMPPLLLEKTDPDVAYAERHIVGSAFQSNRVRAAETIGRWLQAASHQHNTKDIATVSGAVRAMQQALVQDSESDVVKEACALTLITNAKLICSTDPLLCRSVDQALVFISDTTSNGKKLAMALTLFKKAVELFTDEEFIANHEVVCHSLMKLTGKMYRLLEKPLRLRAIVLMHKANSFGSATLKGEFKAFLEKSLLGEEDGDCRALVEVTQALVRGGSEKLSALADSGSSEMRDLSITVLAQAFKDEDADVRRAAATVAGRIGSTTELPHEVILDIAQALKDEKGDVRCAAATALESIGNTTELPHEVILDIAQALKDRYCDVRRAAATALGSIGSTTELPHEVILDIAQALKDENNYVRKKAATALGSIGSTTELPHEVILDIAQALNDKDVHVQIAAAVAIIGIKGRDNSSEEREAALPILTKAFKDEDEYVRRDAARALGSIGSTTELLREVILDIAQALKDVYDFVICAAATALGSIGSTTELPHEVILDIAQALKDYRCDVRSAAATALGSIGSTRELPHEVILDIAQALNDKVVAVQVAAAGAIIGIKGRDNSSEEREAALAILTKALEHDSGEGVREACAKSLASFGKSDEVRKALDKASREDSTAKVRFAAKKSLEKIASAEAKPSTADDTADPDIREPGSG